MAVEYPDIMGDFVDARERFDAGGLQYLCSLEPATIPPGGRTELFFLVQSALDVLLETIVRIEVPTRTGRLGGRTVNFEVVQSELPVNIAAGEVGVLRVPIACAPDTPAKSYEIKVSLETRPQGHGEAIRPPTSPGRLGESLIRDPVGLGIASVIGVGYAAKPSAQQTLKLMVQGEPQSTEADLSPRFETLWTVEDMAPQQTAQREVSDRRVHIRGKLTDEALFVALWRESQTLFEEAGSPLRMGESLFVARALAYTASTFLSRGDWYDALLVPMWMAAIQNDLPTGDALWVVSQVGYEHLLRLSAAVSFGLIDRTMGRPVWSNEEQQAVIDLLADAVCRQGRELPAEFLYLPLILGGLIVARELTMPEEDLNHSLHLLIQAYHDRADVFEGEVAVVNDLFEQLVLNAKK